jgi:hypothetical protein
VKPTSRQTVEHLLSYCDAIYRVLGESAPRLDSDAYVVRVHEMSRAFGALALEMRAHLGTSNVEPSPIIVEILGDAVAGDVTGALVLYAMAMVVGPRLLVSLRDAREAFEGEDELTALLEGAARVSVGEILAIGEVALGQLAVEDTAWQAAARRLTDIAENSPNADSFGISG